MSTVSATSAFLCYTIFKKPKTEVYHDKYLETAIAQALPDNWQQEPETHLPALSLIISNILLPNCCQMSNLNSLAALIEESAVLKQLPAAYKNKLAHTVYDTLARFNGLG